MKDLKNMLKKKIKLGIIFPNIKEWQGGTNYFLSLISVLKLIKKNDFDYKIFSSKGNKKNLKGIIPNNKIIYSKYLDRFSYKYFTRILMRFFYKKDFLLERLLIRHKINIVSHYSPLNKIKSICWIPDLQHKVLTNNFSEQEINSRDKIFNNYIFNASKIIVSSKSSKKHLAKFYKNLNLKKIEVLNFVPFMNLSRIKSLSNLKKKYKLPKNYFFCPNQFWVHKNHLLILKAVENLRKTNIKFKVIFSGSKKDYRNNSHISFLIKKMKNKKIDNFFMILDKIDYEDVISLAHHSNAIINPSNFEGWSSTVEEGKILRKRILLSKIDTHIEQNPEFGNFFETNNFKKLSRYLLIHSKRKKFSKFNKITNNYRYLRNKFATSYYNILKKTL